MTDDAFRERLARNLVEQKPVLDRLALDDGPGHGLITPDAQGGCWAAECVCGWGYVAEDATDDSEKSVYRAFEMHLEHPEVFWPRPGQEVLVDLSAYDGAGLGDQWVRVTRVLGVWSAGVYPVKVKTISGGEGQFRRDELKGCRDPGGEPGLVLSRQVLDTLIAMFPGGCDILPGREPGHIHAQRPDEDETGYRGGVLIVHEGLKDGGCAALGISRNTYFSLPPGGEQTLGHYEEER